jgi:hypothetical protein
MMFGLTVDEIEIGTCDVDRCNEGLAGDVKEIRLSSVVRADKENGEDKAAEETRAQQDILLQGDFHEAQRML